MGCGAGSEAVVWHQPGGGGINHVKDPSSNPRSVGINDVKVTATELDSNNGTGKSEPRSPPRIRKEKSIPKVYVPPARAGYSVQVQYIAGETSMLPCSPLDKVYVVKARLRQIDGGHVEDKRFKLLLGGTVLATDQLISEVAPESDTKLDVLLSQEPDDDEMVLQGLGQDKNCCSLGVADGRLIWFQSGHFKTPTGLVLYREQLSGVQIDHGPPMMLHALTTSQETLSWKVQSGSKGQQLAEGFAQLLNFGGNTAPTRNTSWQQGALYRDVSALNMASLEDAWDAFLAQHPAGDDDIILTGIVVEKGGEVQEIAVDALGDCKCGEVKAAIANGLGKDSNDVLSMHVRNNDEALEDDLTLKEQGLFKQHLVIRLRWVGKLAHSLKVKVRGHSEDGFMKIVTESVSYDLNSETKAEVACDSFRSALSKIELPPVLKCSRDAALEMIVEEYRTQFWSNEAAGNCHFPNNSIVDVDLCQHGQARKYAAQVHVKTLTGKEFQCAVDLGFLVCELKEAIKDREGIPLDQQRLVFKGVQLIDECPLSAYNIENDSHVHLILRMRGT